MNELRKVFDGYLRWRSDETGADYTKVTIRDEGVSPAILVCGNADDLLVAFYDILENAVKAYAISKELLRTQGGKITISAETINGWAHVVISDNGLGMAPEKIHELNARFEKACSGTKSTYVAPTDKRLENGATRTLIGLQHAPAIFADVRVRKGSIRGRMEVRPGTHRGTEFHVWLPALNENNWEKNTPWIPRLYQ
jgi:signal transduction histidine kinase